MKISRTRIPGTGRGYTFEFTGRLFGWLGFRRPSRKVFRAAGNQVNEKTEFDPYLVQLWFWFCHNGVQIGWRFARKQTQYYSFTFLTWPWKRKEMEQMRLRQKIEAVARRKKEIARLRKLGASDGVIEHLWGKS